MFWLFKLLLKISYSILLKYLQTALGRIVTSPVCQKSGLSVKTERKGADVFERAVVEGYIGGI